MKKPQLGIVLLVGALLSGMVFFKRATAANQVAEAARDVVLTVSDPRPLARAADLLQLKFGASISYEDPIWVYSGDTMRALDSPHGLGLKPSNPELKMVIPVGGSLEIRFSTDGVSGKPITPLSQVLQDVLDNYAARGNLGQFQRVTVGNYFSIVPMSARDVGGKLVGQHSPLDVPIRFTEDDRPVEETLESICKTVTAASGVEVVFGMRPKILGHTIVRLGANGEPARDILVRILGEMRFADPHNSGELPLLCWRLFYAPDMHYYVLNIGVVEREVVTPTGAIRNLPIKRRSR